MIIDYKDREAHRLVNSKYPPIAIFDDVANQEEVDDLYAVQSITNPRLQNEIGQINLVPVGERPYGIRGCSYALGPFVHVDPDGSRFSTGEFGVFYCADTVSTAIAETRYHQERRLKNIAGLKYDRIVMSGLTASFSAALVNVVDSTLPGLYHPDDYSTSQQFAAGLRQQNKQGIRFSSVRNTDGICYALFSPKLITDVIQSAHYEYIFDGKTISNVAKIELPK